MAIPKRHTQSPGMYFVTSRTWESRKLFIKREACELFIETLLQYRNEQKYGLHGFVIMPEHFHALITPAVEVTLERAMQYIKGGSSHRLGDQMNFRFPIWQRGYSDHRIRDRRDYEAHVRYIQDNPVKRGLVLLASEYAWSSASGQFKLDDVPQRLKPHKIQIEHGRHA